MTSEEMRPVMSAAYRWWRARRPDGWSEKEHAEAPQAGLLAQLYEDEWLADAVGRLVQSLHATPQMKARRVSSPRRNKMSPKSARRKNVSKKRRKTTTEKK